MLEIHWHSGYRMTSSEDPSSPIPSDEIETPTSDPLHIDDLPTILAQHPYVLAARALPEAMQRELGSFLQDMAIIVEERDKLKKEMTKSSRFESS